MVPGFDRGEAPVLRDEKGKCYKPSCGTGSKACLRASEALGVFVFKYAFSHILDTLLISFLSFLTKNN